MFFKPRWYGLIQFAWAKPDDGKLVSRIEEFRRKNNLTHKEIAHAVQTRPWATLKLQYFCLAQNRKQHPHASDKELWTLVLASRFEVVLQYVLRPPDLYAKPFSEDEVLRRMNNIGPIISNCERFEDVVEYIVQMDTDQGCYNDPTELLYELDDILQGKTLQRMDNSSASPGFGATSVKKEYANLLASAKANPDAVDFRELRMAYVRSSGYIPRTPDALVSHLSEALDKENMDMALQATSQLLDTCYLDIQAHISADSVYEKLGDKERASYHRKFALGLIESIYRSGNGQSCETAFVVVDVREEYAILDCLDMEQITHFTIKHKGHLFSGFQCLNRQTGETVKIYFNTQLREGWIDHILGTEDIRLEN